MTGPKISCCTTSISSWQSVKIVGATKARLASSFAVSRCPPVNTRAPCCLPRSIKSKTFCIWGKLASGPKLVSGFKGSPIRIYGIRSRSFVSKADCNFLGINTRVPLVHTWPELKKFAIIAISAARFRSAFSQIIRGDFPPSSIVTSFKEEPAAITFLPVSTPPVNEIFWISGCSVRYCPISPPPVTTLKTPAGTPASV